MLEEHCQVFRHQHTLIEENLSSIYFQLSVTSYQCVLAASHKEISLGLKSVSVDNEPAFGRYRFTLGQ